LSFIQNLFTSRDNNANSATYVGQQDRLWWDPVTNQFYYSDGQTPGGFPVGGGNTVTNKLVNGAYELVLDASGNVTAPGAISAVGNITANYFVGNGSQLTGLPATYSNAQVSTYLASGTNSANIVTSANISGNYFIGNGSQLTGINVSTNKIFNGNSYANVAVPDGNVEINANGQSWTFDTAGKLSAPGAISAIGNVTANYFIGDGSQLTNLPVGGSNITIQDQGSTLTTAVNTMNFTGNGVVATNVGNIVTVNIIAGSGTLPSQTGNSGKILSTDGVNPLWETMPGVFGLVIDGGDAAFASLDFIIDGGPA
jgi:DNA-binding protein